MPPTKDDPLPVRGCRYALGCGLLLLLFFAATFPWSGFLVYEQLKAWGIQL